MHQLAVMRQELARLALLTSLLAFTLNRADAQPTTNIVHYAYFALRGIEQLPTNGVTAVRVTNKDLMAALNASGSYNFGSGAALLLIGPDGQVPDIVVREKVGGLVTNTAVGNYFGVSEPGDEVHAKNNKVRWGTWLFSFGNGLDPAQATDLQLWGFTTFSRGQVRTPRVGTLNATVRLHSAINGVGGLRGATTVFYGTVDGINSSIEVD